MGISYKPLQLGDRESFEHVKRLIDADLSEPYSIWVYRYFINTWPQLVYLAVVTNDDDGVGRERPVGCIICKSELHRGDSRLRGYIGMLAVESAYRGQGIAQHLVRLAVEGMKECDEIMLETEVDNVAALKLYEKLGFLRTKRMFRYYLNEGDAYRLILPLTEKSGIRSTFLRDRNDII